MRLHVRQRTSIRARHLWLRLSVKIGGQFEYLLLWYVLFGRTDCKACFYIWNLWTKTCWSGKTIDQDRQNETGAVLATMPKSHTCLWVNTSHEWTVLCRRGPGFWSTRLWWSKSAYWEFCQWSSIVAKYTSIHLIHRSLRSPVKRIMTLFFFRSLVYLHLIDHTAYSPSRRKFNVRYKRPEYLILWH